MTPQLPRESYTEPLGYGNAVVVTVTFKEPGAEARAHKLEQAAKRIGHDGMFIEQVEVD